MNPTLCFSHNDLALQASQQDEYHNPYPKGPPKNVAQFPSSMSVGLCLVKKLYVFEITDSAII